MRDFWRPDLHGPADIHVLSDFGPRDDHNKLFVYRACIAGGSNASAGASLLHIWKCLQDVLDQPCACRRCCGAGYGVARFHTKPAIRVHGDKRAQQQPGNELVHQPASRINQRRGRLHRAGRSYFAANGQRDRVQRC